MSSEIKIGDHVKTHIYGCVPAYGIVAVIDNDDFINVYHSHNSDLFAAARGTLRYTLQECTKITPQEYFKQVLSRN